MGALGLLVLLLVLAALGYYAYKAMSGSGEQPSCSGAYNYCMKVCSGTTTEAPAAQASQEAGVRDKTACEGERK
jgi:hypothetical protein